MILQAIKFMLVCSCTHQSHRPFVVAVLQAVSNIMNKGNQE